MQNQYNNLIFFCMLFVWLFYPMILLTLRSKINPLNSKYNPNQFIYYALVIGFCVTTGTIIISSIIIGINLILVIVSILLGLISETIILFPDKLEERFNVNLQSFSHMRKYIIILLFSYVTTLQVIKIIMHY